MKGESNVGESVCLGGFGVVHDFGRERRWRAEQVTYAERLGWPRGTRVVIFHVDDAGMSYDSNMGATRALEQGVATSTSIMMPCPWVPQFAAWVQEHPQIDAGVHLTLNAEWKNYRWGPVAGRSVVPGLTDPHGYLWHGVDEAVGHATPDEFETEIRAQLDKALAMGIKPTHLDSHMGTCFQMPFIERYVKVGIEKQIPILMFGGHLQHVGEEAGAFRPLIMALAQKVWDAGLPVIDDLVTKPTNASDFEGRKRELTRAAAQHEAGRHADHRALHRSDGSLPAHLRHRQGPRGRDEPDDRPGRPRLHQGPGNHPDHLARAEAAPRRRRPVTDPIHPDLTADGQACRPPRRKQALPVFVVAGSSEMRSRGCPGYAFSWVDSTPSFPRYLK